MPNKTIYVSQEVEPLFEEAKQLAGESLSGVIVWSLREFVSRLKEKVREMKEITVKIGSKGSYREQRFIGSQVGKWYGFSEDKEWWLGAQIFQTQKKNWAVVLRMVSKANLVTDPKNWIESETCLADPVRTDLLIAETPDGFAGKLPTELISAISDIEKATAVPSEFLDI
jgi:EXLDI family protein